MMQTLTGLSSGTQRQNEEAVRMRVRIRTCTICQPPVMNIVPVMNTSCGNEHRQESRL